MILQTGVRTLDRVRSETLRRLLVVPAVRRAYTDRAWRLAILHVLFACGALLFALSFPFWQLLLGPALFGYAHLISTVRNVPAAVQHLPRANGLGRKVMGLTLAAGATHVLYRFALDAGWIANSALQQSEWQGVGVIDGLFVAAVCLGFSMLLGLSVMASAWRFLLLTPLVLALGLAPMHTAGALILLHNLVGYVYWIAIAQSVKDRKSGAISLLSVLVVSGLILSGTLDAMLPTHSGEWLRSVTGLSLQSIGQSILPANTDPIVWARLVCAFAFGQSCHYFVWLKAIPETRQRKRAPHTLSNCLRAMEREFTPDSAHVVVYAIGISILLWVFVAVPDMRRFYFLVAAFHGLVELAGLPHLLPFSSARRLEKQE